ncbi:MAG: neutral/alkaline non-lysosomal ceramidase N-terminal domain-containing protein, partial [Verrucomicrobiota bacterium]
MKTTAILFVILLLGAFAHGSDWEAGIAKIDITPTELGWMAGYAARKGPAENVMQPLFAKAASFQDADGARMVVVTLDLIGVPKPIRVNLEKLVADKYGLKPEQLMINASHTHSGPAIRLFRPEGGKGEPRVGYDKVPEEEQPMRVRQIQEYNKMLIEKIGAVIGEAISKQAPAKLSWGRARCGFAMNRRTPLDQGTRFQNHPNPDGPVDHDVPVLQLQDAEGELLGVLFGYACHATVLGTMEIHGDWPGYAQQYFEEDNKGAIAMFVNGCSGDQNPYPRRLQPYVERHGRAMAMAIEAALQTKQLPISGKLRSAIAWPDVPYAPAPTREELEERIKTQKGYDLIYSHFLLAELDSVGSLPKSYPVPVQAIRFGDSLTMVAIGGETTIDYALRLKRELGEKTGGAVWVAGYSNDVMTYIPSDRVLKEGG